MAFVFIYWEQLYICIINAYPGRSYEIYKKNDLRFKNETSFLNIIIKIFVKIKAMFCDKMLIDRKSSNIVLFVCYKVRKFLV